MASAIVIGAGISGMTIAYRLKRDHRVDVAVLEADSRPGGKARTAVHRGFTCEEATNGWLDKEEAVRELISDLGLDERIQPSDEVAERRFIYRSRRLRELEMNPVKFMTSSALPLFGRIRLALEPLIAARVFGDDETLASFASRRLGKSAKDLLIGPMASGVFAGDPERMSLASCFPKVHALERNHGGLIKGMIALKKEKKQKGGDPNEVKAGPSGRLTSLKGGVAELTDALKKELGASLMCGARVTGVRRVDGGAFEVEVEDGARMRADAVVSAAPAHAAAEYLKPLDEDAAEAFSRIPYPGLLVVCLGYEKAAVRHDLNGFGFLVPRQQGKTILGSLFTSSIFPGRAPKGHVLIRTMLGGMLEPDAAALDDEAATHLVRRELSDILGIERDREPFLSLVFRHLKAIPQYHVGHFELVSRIAAAESRHPGFFAAGNALRGIGVVDCVRESVSTAEKVSAHLAGLKALM